jgi:hypothetical protein
MQKIKFNNLISPLIAPPGEARLCLTSPRWPFFGRFIGFKRG